MIKIRFLGAVDGVTGSCHVIEFNDKLILLDCGLYQGKDEQLNYAEFEFNPADIDYLFLSHSHIDHSGRIPLLVKKGFKGTIYCSKPTYDLCEVMLLDSAHIQEAEAEWKNRKAKRSGKPLVDPLYTQADVHDSLRFFKPVLYGQIVKVDDDLTVRFSDAGHILGSSIIEMWFKDENEVIKIVYSGDLGMNEKPLLKDPAAIDSADYVIMESTYGDREHKDVEQAEQQLIDIILKTAERGGSVIIPSFAVGRTQEIIYHLNKYYDKKLSEAGERENRLRKIPVYVDSPLAIKATEVFARNAHVFDEEARDYLMKGDNPLYFENLHFIQSVEESKMLNFSNEPKIIISSSGMCEAGRIKHHLKHNLWKKECSVVFVGYQAEGTLGRRILDGAKEVKILGEDIRVNAEIYDVEGFSSHADKKGLINWLKNFSEKPKKVFLVHGESEAKEGLAKEINDILGIECLIPAYNTAYEVRGKAEVKEIDVAGREELEVSGQVERVYIEKLKNEIVNIRHLIENALKLIEEYLNSDNVDMEKYRKINNSLLEIESKVMDLTILSGR
jgi:metallo-beta-lactamase family protein